MSENTVFLNHRHLWRLVAEWNIGSGGKGTIKDDDLLKQAAEQPFRMVRDGLVDRNDLFQIAAQYTAAVLDHQPFTEGNTVVSIKAALMFLAQNDLRFTATNQELLNIVSDKELDTDKLAEFLKQHTAPAEILG